MAVAQSWEEVGAPYFRNTEVIRALRYAGDATKFIGAYAGGVSPGGIGSPAYRVLTDIFHGGHGDASIVYNGIKTIITYSFQKQAQYELGNYTINQDTAAEERAGNLMTAFLGEELANPGQYIYYNGYSFKTLYRVPNGDFYGNFLLELRKLMIQFHKFCMEYHYIYFHQGDLREKVEFTSETTEYREVYVSDYNYVMISRNYEVNALSGRNTTLSYYTAPGGYYYPGGRSVKNWKIQINDPELELDEMIVVLKNSNGTERLVSASGTIENPHYLGAAVPDHDIEDDNYDVAVMARMRMKSSNKWWVR